MAAVEFRYVRMRAFVVAALCTNERETERGERKRKKEKERRTRVHIHSYCNTVHWTTTTYGRHPCVQRTSSCQKIVVV